ncbi:cyclophilin-like fold protein [Aeromicrobium senzhongii]|nr:cyclophilin-like fold protein [Aeromicrobium senzhongii]
MRTIAVSRVAVLVLAAVALPAVVAACGTSNGTPDGTNNSAAERSTAIRTPTTEAQENIMQIRITIGDERFTATLDDSAAADDLLAQLPVTIDMVDHGGVEKTGPLPSPLSLAGQPEGADPDVGDLGYYAPGRDLVLYYGDQSYFDGIVVLGRLDGDAAKRIAQLDGNVTARVEAG